MGFDIRWRPKGERFKVSNPDVKVMLTPGQTQDSIAARVGDAASFTIRS
jgi:glyoxylase-like metal-dependent hydrolase (beta-lactamase superfamily II)